MSNLFSKRNKSIKINYTKQAIVHIRWKGKKKKNGYYDKKMNSQGLEL